MQPEPDLEAIEATLRALFLEAEKPRQRHDREADIVAPSTPPPPPPLPKHVDEDDYDGPHDANLIDVADQEAVEPVVHYPDLVPRTHNISHPKTPTTDVDPPKSEAAANTTKTNTSIPLVMQDSKEGPLSETLFLLALLFGTCFLLYIFPAGSWIYFLSVLPQFFSSRK